MDPPPKLLDLVVEFGDDSNQKDFLLADINAFVSFLPQQIANLKAKYNPRLCGQEEGISLIIKFNVSKGREQEAIAYLKESFTYDPELVLSPLQKLFKNPTQQKLQFTAQDGFIVVEYFLRSQVNCDIEEIVNFLNQSQGCFQQFTFKACLKGEVRHNKQNKVKIQVDYAKLALQSPKANLDTFLSMLKNMFNQQELLQVPVIRSILSKQKTIRGRFKFKSLRKIRSYIYNRFYQKSQIVGDDADTKYLNRGIFINTANIGILNSNRLGVSIDCTYGGQDVMMRLIQLFSYFTQLNLI